MTAVVDVSPIHCSREPDNRALQAALELSMVNISSSSLTDIDLSFSYWDGCEVNSKSLNVTQCVTVPSSEHVAEIVGKQGELDEMIVYKTWNELLKCRSPSCCMLQYPRQ